MVSANLTNASGESSSYDFLNLYEIKTYLAIDGSSQDSMLTDMYYAVCENVEKVCNQTLKNRTVTIYFDKNHKYLELLYRPVTSITSVTKYNQTDASGEWIENTNYYTYGLKENRTGNYVIEPATEWDSLEVVYNSDGSVVPYEIKMAVLGYMKVVYNDDRMFEATKEVPPPPVETINLLRKYMLIAI